MQTIEQLRGKIASASDLLGVVKTMKGLAAVHIRQYEKAVESLRDYSSAVVDGLQIVLGRADPQTRFRPPPAGHGTLAVLLGSDQGFVGQFNGRLLDHALSSLGRDKGNSPSPAGCIVVGRQLATAVESTIGPPSVAFDQARSVDGIAGRARDILLAIQDLRQRHDPGRILLFHNRPRRGAGYEETSRHIFPLDGDWLENLRNRPWPSNQLPASASDVTTALSLLVQEYLYVSIYQSMAESLAAENASRLASMQAAEQNIEERIEALNQQYHRRRQSVITEEILDVMAGYEATK